MNKFLVMLTLMLAIAPAVFAHPGSDVIVDDEGQVYFTDTAKGVWKVDKTGAMTLISKQNWHWMAGDLKGRYADSRLAEWFTKVKVEGTQIVFLQCSDFPTTMGADGNLYYADTMDTQPGRIMRRLPSGEESLVAEMPSAPKSSFVTGMTAGPDNTLYITVSAGSGDATTIWKIGADGKPNLFATVAIPDSVHVQPKEDMPNTYCRDLAVDADGNVLVAATGSQCVLKITPTGLISVVFQDDAPWAVTGITTFAGEIYMLEYDQTGTDRQKWVAKVRKIAKDGTVADVAAVAR